MIDVLYHQGFDADVLHALAALPLTPSWRRLVEGREDNFKVTTPADLARFAFELSRRA